MDRFLIRGGKPLRGTVPISGSKNAALPILLASILTDEKCFLENVPSLRDIQTVIRLLECIGKKVIRTEGAVEVQSQGKKLAPQVPYSLVSQMRASVLVAGPLLARWGRACFPLPGGCAIGLRPIDLHLFGFAKLGAVIRHRHGDIELTSPKLRGNRIRLPFPSVGATENILMAAVLASGTTAIENAAREPEIADLARCLKQMGADIEGAGTRRIRIRGVLSLRGFKHRTIPDRLEAGTYLLAAAITHGQVRLTRTDPGPLAGLLKKLRRAGCRIRAEKKTGLSLSAPKILRATSIHTRPYPGFPTDLQSPWMALMATARGKCRIQETIFEKRFLHAAELQRMGAKIYVRKDTATVKGVPQLTGAPIMASDIRGGAALVLAALAAKGTSSLQRVYHIDRGYEKMERKLRKLGALIKRIRQ